MGKSVSLVPQSRSIVGATACVSQHKACRRRNSVAPGAVGSVLAFVRDGVTEHAGGHLAAVRVGVPGCWQMLAAVKMEKGLVSEGFFLAAGAVVVHRWGLKTSR